MSSTTVPTHQPYVSATMSTPLTARWADDISRIIVGDDRSDHPGATFSFAVHLDVEATAELAGYLIEALAASGAAEKPEALLNAFPEGQDAADLIRVAHYD